MVSRLKKVIGAVVLATMVAGCTVAPVMPPRGIVFSDQKAPLFAGRETGTKEGQAAAYCVLFLFAWGDASIEQAAKSGGITQIKHTDYRLFNVLGIFQQYTTIVRGD
jgi:hypothetical protein